MVNELRAMRIGVDNVVMAIVEKDTLTEYKLKQTDGENPTDLIYDLPGVMSLNINPNMSIATAFYDDSPSEVASTLGNIEVTFNKSSLGLKEQAILLGSTYIQAKVKDIDPPVNFNELVSGVADTPSEVAIGFRSLKSDSYYKYTWLLKGKFTIPTFNNETKGETINFQADEITGRFTPTIYSWKLDATKYPVSYANKLVNPWKIDWDETACNDATIRKFIRGNWFKKVTLPNYSNK